MPIYDYHCDHCGHAFSSVQRFADDPISVCPSCGKPPRRLLSNPALVFKGSGWYKTDSRGPERKDAGKGTDKGAPKGDAEPAGKTEKAETSEKPAAADGGSAAKTGDTAARPAAKPEKAAPASS